MDGICKFGCGVISRNPCRKLRHLENCYNLSEEEKLSCRAVRGDQDASAILDLMRENEELRRGR